MRFSFFRSAVLLSGIALLSSCSESYDISFNPEKGAKYITSISVTSSTQEQIGPTNRITNTIDISDFNMRLDTIDTAGNRYLTFSFARTKHHEVSNNQVQRTYDTNDTLNVVPGNYDHMHWEIYKSAIDQEFQSVFTKKAEVKSTTNIEKIFNNIRSVNSASMELFQIASQARNTFTADFFKNYMEANFKVYPNAEVKKGDYWNIAFGKSPKGDSTYYVTYTLKEVRKTVYVVTVHSDISFTVDLGTPGSNAGTKTQYAKVNGTIEIDRNTGLITSGALTQESGSVEKTPDYEYPIAMVSEIKISTRKLQ